MAIETRTNDIGAPGRKHVVVLPIDLHTRLTIEDEMTGEIELQDVKVEDGLIEIVDIGTMRGSKSEGIILGAAGMNTPLLLEMMKALLMLVVVLLHRIILRLWTLQIV